MRSLIKNIIPAILIVASFFSAGCSGACSNPETAGIDPDPVIADRVLLARFFDKENVKIAITDSGLGGLSITAEAVSLMKEMGVFGKADFIFYNALFSNEGGYNSLSDRAEKIGKFSAALNSLSRFFNPDIIIIGCNTLSVLYDETEFSSSAGIPVVGIVESGVWLIGRSIRETPGAKVIIFGTQTTIEEGVHREKLIESGIPAENVFEQACPELTNYIELGYQSPETEMLIGAYVDEALSKMGNEPEPFYASLNCTHYGYSMELWRKSFEYMGHNPMEILNPNRDLVKVLYPEEKRARYENPEISVRVISGVRIEPERIKSIEGYLRDLSPLTSKALVDYEFREDLFEKD
ncbi:MAG: hypothetical protein GF417_07425 [Candidatus Latescibacteria bacterium]|nr:hypothetical protein [bacterium]MBD3424250.1 hypothetical protein [Candidatus Latescibacterota bacterium]